MSKRYNQAKDSVEDRVYLPQDAIATLKEFPKYSFDETVELHTKLGVDPKHADQMVRGTVELPEGTGKQLTVLCLTKSGNEESLKNAGADYVGCDQYIEDIKNGWLDFDVVIASPDVMVSLSKVARKLGPRGLMPSQKNGTISTKLEETIESFKKGKVEYKTDKAGNIHVIIGKKSFTNKQLYTNFVAMYKAIEKAKPSSAKGTYFVSMHLCTTMSPSIKVESAENEWEKI